MNKRQSNFSSMSLAISHFYTKYEATIKANTVLSRLFDEFFSHFRLMEEAVLTQKGHTSEAAKLKQKEEDEMLEAVCRNAAKGYVYASENGFPGLQETFSVSSWKLQKLSDVNLHTTCLNVHNALTTISSRACAAYGIEADDLTKLKKEIDDFYALISVPRSNIITRSQATTKIDEEMKQLQSLLTERLDKMMGALPDSFQVMKNEYKAARIIISKSGGGSESESESNTAPEPPKV